MKKYLNIISIFAIALFLESCSTMVVSNFNDLSMLKKGMDESKVDQIFDDNDLRDANTFTVPSTNFTVKNVYVLVQYIETDQTASYGANSSTRTRTDYVYNTYRLVFEKGKLLYWGFDYEFNTSEDIEMRRIGLMLKTFVRKEPK